MAPRGLVSVSPSPPSPLPPDLRSSLTNALLSTTAIPDLHTSLLSSCQSTGWLDAVRERALQLLRNGECGTYGEVMDVLVREAKRGEEDAGRDSGNGMDGNAEGDGLTNGTERKAQRDKRKVDVRIPEKVISDGVMIVREALDKVVQIEKDEDDDEDDE